MHTSHRITLITTILILILTTLTPTIARANPNSLPTDPNFKGIYEFSSHNSSTDATNSAIAGTYLGYYWSQLEPQQGQYNWDLIDQQMQPWIDNGKNVILRVATADWTSWDPNSNSGNATPQWVYDLGVSSVTEVDNAVTATVLEPAVPPELQRFYPGVREKT